MSILGKHTLDETRDLLAVADYRFKETGKAYDELTNKPVDITADWDALKEKWAKARVDIRNSLIKIAVMNGALPASVVATESEWRQILGFIQFQENVKGSLQDITRRIEKVSGKQIRYDNQPNQNSSDVDISLFKDLDNATRNMDAAAEAAKRGAKEAAFSNWGLIIGGTMLATVIGMQALKRSL